MGKLLAGFGFCFALGSLPPALAQDPFAIQSYERSSGSSQFLEAPSNQSDAIIQPIPIAQRERAYNEKPLTSRPKNAHVRSTRTPAEEYIYHREVYHAKQRTLRMEHRKWRGESLLRPGSPKDPSWMDSPFPAWFSAHRN